MSLFFKVLQSSARSCGKKEGMKGWWNPVGGGCKLCHMWKFGFCLVSVEVPRALEQTWGSPGQQHLHGLGAEGPTVPSALRQDQAVLWGERPARGVLRHVCGVPACSRSCSHHLKLQILCISTSARGGCRKRKSICKSFSNYCESLQHLKHLSCLG